MSKKLWFVLGALVLGLAACTSNPTVSVTPTAAPTAIPTGTIALVTALYLAIPRPNQTVNETTELNGGPNTGVAPIASQVTAANGTTTFTGLTPGNTYCWYFDFVVSPTETIRQSACNNHWNNGVTVGT
ncbi:MAG TPA: hypothetical protein VMS32_06035 [Verrucomicrobiae bacterium]|jgi:hypothetical protein|nr:hypothetical protein [Verrucomicrobiae bacterium]